MRTLPLLVPALLLGACTVGPNYAGPPKTLADATGTAGFKRAGPRPPRGAGRRRTGGRS